MDPADESIPSPADNSTDPGYRAATELTAKDQELQALFKGVRDYAIFTVDTNGVISSWHEGAQRMKGYTAEEAIGMPFAKLFTDEEQRKGQPSREMKIAADEGEYQGEGPRVRKNGELFEASVVLTALRGPRDELLGFLKLTQDISARKQAERDREAALEAAHRARTAAERASRSMSEFVAMVSHELRTPLSAILGWAQVLERNPGDHDRLSKGLAAIARNARLQTRLIEDLLDMNRLESGSLRLEWQRVELPAVINAAVEAAAPMSRDKGVRLRTDLDTTVAAISGDPGRLEQIVGNLLSNAIRFTPPGGQVTVSLKQDDDEIELAVSDTGQGIEPQFLAHIFERFRQQEGGTTRRHGGLGIGLAIVQQLVQQHGGSVRARSAGLDQGTTLIVSLLVAASPDRSRSPGPEATQNRRSLVATTDRDEFPLEGARLVLVDDDEDGRNVAAFMLRGAGAEVFEAGGAIDGLALVQTHRPSLLISDIGMPGHDGHDLIGWVRALEDELLASTPALALTAFAADEDERRALDAGFAARLVKPIEPDVLLEAASTWRRR